MLPAPFDTLDPSLAERRVARAGEVLFREGDPARGLFVALDVAVQLVRVTSRGDRVVIHGVKAGDSFAEASLFADVYHCDAVALGAGTVARLGKEAVLPLLGDPVFAKAFARVMSGQVRHYRLLVEILSVRSAEERVFAGMVAGLLDGAVTDFAATIGLSHEAVYRALRRLVRAGRVRQEGRGRYRVL